MTVGEPLPDADPGRPRLLRTGVLAQRLAMRGHQVDWWTSTFDHYGKRQRASADRTYHWQGVDIHMLHSVGYGSNLSPLRFVEHAHVAAKFARRVRQWPKPDVVLASLPTVELARSAVRYGIEFGVPVLLDIRDLWPDALIDLAPRPLRGPASLALWPMQLVARASLRQCQGIIGISDSYLQWGLRLAGRERRDTDGVYPLGYVAPLATQRGYALARERLRQSGVDESKALCWYVGSFGRLYDLGPVLRAAELAASEFPHVQFVISGEGERGVRWRNMAGTAGNVVFTGWIGADEIAWLRQSASVGLQPYVAGAPQGLANKLFEYLSAGLPVVSSLAGENAQLIAQHQCGVTYQAGDGLDCYEKLRPLLADEGLRRRMGANGRRLFQDKFDADTVFDGLAQHLERIANSNAT